MGSDRDQDICQNALRLHIYDQHNEAFNKPDDCLLSVEPSYFHNKVLLHKREECYSVMSNAWYHMPARGRLSASLPLAGSYDVRALLIKGLPLVPVKVRAL